MNYRTGGANSPTQPIPTLANQGMDDTVDSDFVHSGSQDYQTLFFIAEEGATVTMDLGVLP